MHVKASLVYQNQIIICCVRTARCMLGSCSGLASLFFHSHVVVESMARGKLWSCGMARRVQSVVRTNATILYSYDFLIYINKRTTENAAPLAAPKKNSTVFALLRVLEFRSRAVFLVLLWSICIFFPKSGLLKLCLLHIFYIKLNLDRCNLCRHI